MQMLQRMQAEHSRLAAKPSNSSSSANSVQRAYELNTSKDVKVTKDHRAKEVFVTNLSGESLWAAANSPSVSPFGWNELWKAGHTLGNRSEDSSHYNAVRMHLWNGRLGGPGNETWNLAPGPAKINSMMSAGPEMAAKLLVDAGYEVWLHTKVSYMNDSTNANDFTSVVPHRIDMEWGVMGQKASGSWGTDIQLPVAPLSGLAAQEYKDWEKGKTSELVSKLSSATDQVRAQAYDLVQHDELRLAILKAYPQIYLGMDIAGQGGVLQKMGDKMLVDFLTNVLQVVGKPEQLVEQAVLPLAEVGAPLRAQALFGKLSPSDQRKAIISYKWNLLQHLGKTAEMFSMQDWTIFQYNPEGNKAYLLDLMQGASQIDSFLAQRTKPERKSLFDLWANNNSQFTAEDKTNFIKSKPNVSEQYKQEYGQAMEAENISKLYMEQRSKRRRVPVKRFEQEKKLKVSKTKVNGGGVKKRGTKRRKTKLVNKN